VFFCNFKNWTESFRKWNSTPNQWARRIYAAPIEQCLLFPLKNIDDADRLYICRLINVFEVDLRFNNQVDVIFLTSARSVMHARFWFDLTQYSYFKTGYQPPDDHRIYWNDDQIVISQLADIKQAMTTFLNWTGDAESGRVANFLMDRYLEPR
jgi:hypothetical protein